MDVIINWEDILVKTEYCKMLINLLSYNYYYNKSFSNAEGFLILKFLKDENIHFCSLYKSELDNLQKVFVISNEIDYSILPVYHKDILKVKALLNIIGNEIYNNSNYAKYNKKNIVNLLESIKDKKLDLDYYNKVYDEVYKRINLY